MTEISLIVTLNNQFTLPYQNIVQHLHMIIIYTVKYIISLFHNKDDQLLGKKNSE